MQTETQFTPAQLGKALYSGLKEVVAQIRVKNGHWIDTPHSQVQHLADGLHDLYTAPQELAKADPMEITVKRTKVYGNETIYPVCDTAICLTMLGDTKTLTPRQIGIIKALGYKIVLEQQEEV